jgi:hypothetical protein
VTLKPQKTLRKIMPLISPKQLTTVIPTWRGGQGELRNQKENEAIAYNGTFVNQLSFL